MVRAVGSAVGVEGIGAVAVGGVAGAGPSGFGGAGALVSEFGSLRGLQAAAGELLRDLRESSARADALGRTRLARDRLGGGADAWAEAAGLHAACTTLTRELVGLARVLDASVESVGATAASARRGYAHVDAGVDADVRGRVRAAEAGRDGW